MKTREKIIAFLMVVVFIFWVSNFFKKPEKKQRASKTRAGSSQGKLPQKEKTKEAPQEEKIVPVDLEGVIAYVRMEYSDAPVGEFSDPFKELDPRAVLDTTVMDFTQLKLAGIIWEEEEPMALINDQILKRGDMISGFKIFEIRKSEVVLIKGLERYILKLPAQVQAEE